MVRSAVTKHQSHGSISIIPAIFFTAIGYVLGQWNLISYVSMTSTGTVTSDTVPYFESNEYRKNHKCMDLLASQSQLAAHDFGNGDGWHAVHVFYGKEDQLTKMLPQQNEGNYSSSMRIDSGTGTAYGGKMPDLEWFSQADQDQIVSRLFKGKRKGYFVDLAANDATILSNTYSLEKYFGWTGLCIEPNPIYWSNLTYRKCEIVAAVVGNTRMQEVMFRFDNGDHGGIAGDGFDNGKRFQKSSQPRYTVTLREILERFRAPKVIDYLSLDVEGAEEFILHAFPMESYNISLMTVERPKESLRALLEKNGFKLIKRLTSWGETLWAHDSIMHSLNLSILDEFSAKKPSP